MSGRSISISVVVPVYNGEQTLCELVSRVQAVLSGITDRFELIFVNDGSTDSSWQNICALAGEHSWVHGLNLMRNYGQHNAVLAGVREANCEIVVTIDDDLQHPPEKIPRLLAKLDEGYDVVYGVPQELQHGLWRNASAWSTKMMLRYCMGMHDVVDTSPFRAFRSELRAAFTRCDGPYVDLDALIAWGSERIAVEQVEHDTRNAGVSGYTFRKLLSHTINMLTGFSVVPLRLVNLLGFLLTFFGLAVLVYVIGRYMFEEGSVPGFPFLASTIAIFSGAQLFALGIIGEYLARMHFRLLGKPSSVVRNRTSQSTCAAVTDTSHPEKGDDEHTQ